MRIYLALFGREVLDLHIGSDWEAEPACSLDGGTTASTPIGFAPTPPLQLEGNPDRWEPLYDD